MRNASAGPQLKKENDVLTSTRKDFGKLDRKPIPLDDRLYLLSEQELYLVLQTAQFVKLAHGFGERSTQPYIQLVREMYPKVSFNLQNIIAEVLQDAEPIEAKPKPNRRDEIISETIKEYEGIEDPDAKVERIQAAVLDKLKLND